MEYDNVCAKECKKRKCPQCSLCTRKNCPRVYCRCVELEQVAENMIGERESKWRAKIRPGIDVPTMKFPLKARNLTDKHVHAIEKTLPISEEKDPMDLILVNEAFDITDKNLPSRAIRECKLENVNSDSLYRIQLYLKNVIEKLGHKCTVASTSKSTSRT